LHFRWNFDAPEIRPRRQKFNGQGAHAKKLTPTGGAKALSRRRQKELEQWPKTF
jgi:hypothetical protein